MIITFIAALLAALAIGAVIYSIAKITYNWLHQKINEKLAKKNVKKLLGKTVERMVAECENVMSKEEFNNFKNTVKDQDFCMATINENNEVEEIEFVKDTNWELDREVAELLSNSKQEIVVTN